MNDWPFGSHMVLEYKIVGKDLIAIGKSTTVTVSSSFLLQKDPHTHSQGSHTLPTSSEAQIVTSVAERSHGLISFQRNTYTATM